MRVVRRSSFAVVVRGAAAFVALLWGTNASAQDSAPPPPPQAAPTARPTPRPPARASTSQPTDGEVTSDTTAQFYEMRSPTGQTIIARRRLTTTLGVAVYDLFDKVDDPRA